MSHCLNICLVEHWHGLLHYVYRYEYILDNKTKVLAFLLLVLFGGILGGGGYIIPTLFDAWINYIGYPVLQLIALIALAIRQNKNRNLMLVA